ncbi:DNAJB8 [Acrasis kona]|uniref:DNAJB8 n=2 Tax=Acrasis kona TaxID=1008807 RepID=A0AAW2ZRU9_9EUKA
MPPKRLVDKEEAEVSTNQYHATIINPLMVYETQRSLIPDDVRAINQVFNPKEQIDESDAVMHHTGFKKKTTAASRRGKSKNKEHGVCFKVFCCCYYYSNKYFNIEFGWFIMGSILMMLLGVAYLKLDENTFGLQSLYNLEEINYYNVLNITNDATTPDIRRAHRRAVITWHPDRNPNCGEECTKKMSLISEAYSVLTNPEARAFHDKHGVKPPEKMIRAAKETQASSRTKDRKTKK